MFLSKLDALTLSKVLFHYDMMTRMSTESDDFSEMVFELSDRIDEYLTSNVSSALTCDKSHDSVLSDDDDDGDHDHDDACGEECAGVVIPAHTATISAEVLHDLPPVVVTRDLVSGELEFECLEDEEDAEVFVLWNGSVLHDDNVVRVCRTGKIVDLWTLDGQKLSFEFKKINKEWKSAFGDGVVYLVE